MADVVQISGLVENQARFEHLLSTDPGFDTSVKGAIRKVLKEARGKISEDAKSYIQDDPRKAYRAVKHTVYKSLFGGNVSILSRPLVAANNRLDQYYGSDRGFILRFLSSGTTSRQTRYGNRGAIRQTNMFGHIATWHMQQAAEDVANAINEYVKHVNNG